MTGGVACRIVAAVPLATALRIDGRRPAGWIALAAAAWAGWALMDAAPPLRLAAAVAGGGLLAAAAIGSTPSGAPRVAREPWVALGAFRVGWPVAGFMLSGSVVAAAFAVATALVVTRSLRRPSSRAGATSLGLAITGAAAAAALVAAAVGGGAVTQVLAAVVAWALLAAGALLDPAVGVWEWPAAGLVASPRRWPESGHGFAMATSLAAMVGCFFLVPGLAWAYAPFAVGWFVCLAVPAVLDADPTTAARWLIRASPGRPAVPGTVARGVKTCAVLAAVLGWPAMVAAVLPAADGGRQGSPLVAIVALAAAVVAVLLAAAATAATGGRADTPRALVLSFAALVAVEATRGKMPTKPPVLPALPAFAAGRARPTGVEPSGASCETPHPAQPSGSSSSPVGVVEIRRGGAR